MFVPGIFFFLQKLPSTGESFVHLSLPLSHLSIVDVKVPCVETKKNVDALELKWHSMQVKCP